MKKIISIFSISLFLSMNLLNNIEAVSKEIVPIKNVKIPLEEITKNDFIVIMIGSNPNIRYVFVDDSFYLIENFMISIGMNPLKIFTLINEKIASGEMSEVKSVSSIGDAMDYIYENEDTVTLGNNNILTVYNRLNGGVYGIIEIKQ